MREWAHWPRRPRRSRRGDGALTGGWQEAINNIGDHKDGNLVIIVNTMFLRSDDWCLAIT